MGRREEGRQFIAESPIMVEKLQTLAKIAAADAPVLLLGESGVGKELFAEMIHRQSARTKKPFVAVNCAALPEGLAESELFGHVKGAFSGAERDRKGRIELAEGGTLFLDEAADIPLPIQAKLLRVLAEKSFEKVGGEETLRADVRIVAATNKNLESLIAEGLFRKDLYYRLNVLTLRVPPLRERGDDIIKLAAFFLERFEASGERRFAGFTAQAQEALMGYSWPGNVRELAGCIERAAIVSVDGGYIEADSLALTGDREDTEGLFAAQALKTALNNFKRRFILVALMRNNWNQTRTAKVLEVERTYLSRLIKELKIERET